MANITCAKCGQEAEQMAEQPLGGAAGRQVLANICEACWNEWKAQQILVINHYALMLHNAEHRAQLLGMMREYLNLEPSNPPAQLQPG